VSFQSSSTRAAERAAAAVFAAFEKYVEPPPDLERRLLQAIEQIASEPVTHRPAFNDPNHTACGLKVERFPVDMPLQLGEGETCTACTNVVRQIALAREYARKPRVPRLPCVECGDPATAQSSSDARARGHRPRCAKHSKRGWPKKVEARS
jgi:hypothetical protein